MRTQYFTIAGGNKTCLVWDLPQHERSALMSELLHGVDQVGFIEENASPTLTMMGDELCINGIFAFVSTLESPRGVVYASGIQGEIQYQHTENGIHITFELPYQIKGDVVAFEGIAFRCGTVDIEPTREEFQQLAKEYKVPAFGIIEYDEKQIYPSIYVAKTNSLMRESACGSGSIAAHLVTGICHVVQPTGETIFVEHTGITFSVHATVRRLI
ncbi:MAG: hypothetical protein WAW13_02340 [Minisyncoccia bacterium]